MIVGLLKPENGKILLDGEDITHMPMHKRCRAGIGYLPQEASVFRKMTVYDNIMSALEFTFDDVKIRKERSTKIYDYRRYNQTGEQGVRQAGAHERHSYALLSRMQPWRCTQAYC